MIKTQTLESFFEEGRSFIELLPYHTHENGFFVLKDGSLGQIWEISLIESETKSASHLEELSRSLEGILLRLPEDMVSCQVILVCDNGIGKRLKAYEGQSGVFDNEIIRSSSESKIKHLEEGRHGFFEQAIGAFSSKRIRCFFTLRYFPTWVYPAFGDKVRFYFTGKDTIGRKIEQDFLVYCQTIARFCEVVEGVFKASEISYLKVDEKELHEFLYLMLNPKHSQGMRVPDLRQDGYMADQVLYNAPRVSGEGFEFEDRLFQVVTLKELPLNTEPGMFSAEIVRGMRFSMLDMMKDFTMVINFHIPRQEEALKRIKMQKAFAFLQRSTYFGDKSIEAQEKKEELDSVVKETFSSGHKIIYPRIHFIVSGESQESCNNLTDNMLNALSRMGAEGLKEEIIAGSLFLSCLPLCFDHHYEKFIKRTRRIVSDNLADMLPLYGSVRGTQAPAQLYLNRRGEPVFWDFFDSNTNPHTIVIGASGSGKSFFVNDFILQNARLDSHFFVLDKGDSYKKLCSVLGGQYIRFELNDPVTINPFLKVPDAEHLAFLVTMLSQMCSGGDERERLLREHEGVLQQAILAAYKGKTKDQELVLSDVVEKLKSHSCNRKLGVGESIGIKLALKLRSFTKEGPFGKFFDGKNQFSLGAKFTVFELGNLSSHQDLQVVVLLNIMYFITHFVSQSEMKPKRKFLLIDEAWSLLKLQNTADFITNSFKTYRKYRCSCCAITQEITDLIGKECGIAIQANAANKVFLKQEPNVIDSLRGFASLSDKEIELLKSVETQKGRFSEALMISDSSRGVIRLVPDPFLYWLATSDAKDNAYLEEKVKKFEGRYLEALSECAKEKPYGLR
ncbi:putative conjugative transfer protein TraC [Candidatus Velamenicoccus archaeovorus]|uniref:Putative conjugative transfer protein TraC n=1 Tax=Velamenicoccus archaeovorus TaxID=1930593 RepID=A0A410P3L5_VELA1|nr:TraC family protein [Candidatus Velamenicoccus archaeovorus]QAT16681.1 putative conjugative transfer protein TraC [Candidatus Velamenicoccus archaeovorus]